MPNENTQVTPQSNLPDKPEWLKEFRQRTLLIDVIEKAFDPSVSDKEVRNGLIAAADSLKELGLPPEGQPKISNVPRT